MLICYSRRLHPKRQQYFGSPALTIVEMLVVASILIIVGSLLLPIVARTAEEARKVVCNTNLRQIGGALNSYATDSNSLLPFRTSFAREQLADGSADHRQALGLLRKNGYISDPKAFFCPSEMEKKFDTQYPRDTGEYYGNYLYFGADSDKGQYNRNRVTLSGVGGRAIAADLDISTGITILNLWDRIGKTHLGAGQNVLYVKGHVRWLPLVQTLPDDPLQVAPTFDKIDGQ